MPMRISTRNLLFLPSLRTPVMWSPHRSLKCLPLLRPLRPMPAKSQTSPLFLMEMFLCPIWIVQSVSIKTQLPFPTPHVLTNWRFLPLILQFRLRVLDHAGLVVQLVARLTSKTMSLSGYHENSENSFDIPSLTSFDILLLL